MRFSDAVAIGRVLAKPTSDYFQSESRGCACARGMACLAIGIKGNTEARLGSLEKWPWLEDFFVHPCYGKCEDIRVEKYLGFGIINHLMFHVTGTKFDRPFPQTWTLDQLIDWARSVEPNEEIWELHTSLPTFVPNDLRGINRE
jgi:hypothetical protein